MHTTRIAEGCGCDSLAPDIGMMSIADALDLALTRVAPVKEMEVASLIEALGRSAAQCIYAPAAMPFFDNAAMDGFALRCADLDGRCCLPIAGTVAAGDAPCSLPHWSALRIFTGARLPAGADAVMMIEACIDKTHRVHFNRTPATGENIRRAGSDQAAGQVLITAGTRIAAHHIGLLAANSITEISVIRRPHVAVFSTGDELCHGLPAAGQIPDANRPMLLALASQAGADVTDLGILPDATALAFKDLAAEYDLVLFSGEVSMGGKDHIRDALTAAGGTVHGWRVALKPGKPIMFGQLGTAAFAGLPGNPFAVHVGFHMFVLPQIMRLLGAKSAPFAQATAVAGFEWTRKLGHVEVFPVRIAARDATGLPVLERLGQSVSASLLPLGDADGLAIVSADTSYIHTGAALLWRPFCSQGAMQRARPLSHLSHFWPKPLR